MITKEGVEIMNEIVNLVKQSLGGYVPQLIGALAILIIGWLLAIVIAGAIRGIVRRTGIDNRLVAWFGEEKTGSKAPDFTAGIGRGVFWLIMILVLTAVLQVLDLTLATAPLNQFLAQVFQFLPRLVGAAILAVLAWITAVTIRLLLRKALKASKVDERIGRQLSDKEPFGSVSRTIADAAYWLVFLLFLPAVLDALKLQGLLEPVQSMMNRILGFLPNLLAAALIALVGWFVARLVRRIVENLAGTAGGDRLGDRVGLPHLSRMIGLVVYTLILIPVLIAALNALALEAVTRPASLMLNKLLAAFPSIFAAAVVVLIAYAVGRLVSGLVTELLTGIGFNTILVRLGIGKAPVEGRRTPSEIVGYLALVAIMLFAALEASGLLGFEALSELTAEATVFGGHILVGLVIFGIGLYLANLAAQAIQSSGVTQSRLLSITARMAIMVLSGAMALRHMGLADEIISLAFALIVGAVAVAAAVAFGIGGRDLAKQKLAQWFREKPTV